MPIRKPDSNVELAESRETIGKGFRRWRERNGLSQQVIHNFSQAKKIPLHNSQIAHFENGVLDPKAAFYVSLGVFNQCIADKKLPPTQENFSKTDRDRLKEAEPYLDSEGNIADAVCFFAQFIGAEPINELYKTPKGFTEKEADNCTDFMTAVFNAEVKKRKLDKGEAWKEFEQHLARHGLNKHYQWRTKEVIVYGGDKWTAEEINDFTKNKTDDCPIRTALCEFTGLPLASCPSQQEICDKGLKLAKSLNTTKK